MLIYHYYFSYTKNTEKLETKFIAVNALLVQLRLYNKLRIIAYTREISKQLGVNWWTLLAVHNLDVVFI